MKIKIVTILIIVILITLQIGAMQAKAEMKPLTSEIYQNANAELLSTGKATFKAAIQYRATINVSSCILQKKVGNTWVFDQSLSCPPSMSNTLRYSKTMDYSAKLTIGTTYRIVAVFDADGETKTVTSNEMAY